uniref:TIR domain-containing protein n=1 Tax=Lactuca sativa TaxID=4236 RepID=A0A9R1V332_LACSA|nr:hypothetical protein LSAT_V11C700361450 [Lactuca sativa]
MILILFLLTLQITELMTDSLKNMDNLKLLQLKFVQLTGSYENFSEQLRWLCWIGFHLRTIPSDLFMGNLVALDMSYSCLEVFEPPMILPSLQILNLKDSHKLLEIHNISRLPNLETLILWNCHSLVHVCETIRLLNSLALLNMTGCEKLWKSSWKMQHKSPLKELKVSTSDERVKGLSTFSLPPSLQRLFLNDCYLESTDYSPLCFSSQSFLQYLNLGNNLFEFLPMYNHLKNLRVLDLTWCLRLKWILCLPSTLAELYVYYCKSLERVTFESCRFTLQEFGYEGCLNLLEIEGFIKLVPLVKLDETDLGHLKWLKEHQNHKVCLVGDDELTKGRSLCIQILYEFNIMSTSLPDINDPNMTPDYISESTSLSFNVPLGPKDRRLKGLNIILKYKTSGEDWAWFTKITTSNGVDLMYNPIVFGKPASGEVAIWLSYWPIGNTLKVGDRVNVSTTVMNGLEILECGVSLVYTHDDDEVVNETLENDMEWVKILGGDYSGFQLRTGAYYLCRRDFFEFIEVGRLTPDWFKILVGDSVDCTEIRGWRKTGRPQQLNQSFIELKTVKCIVHASESEQIYKIGEMSKSSHVGKTLGIPSMISATASKSADTDVHTSKASIAETIEFTSSSLKETMKSATRSESSVSESESVEITSPSLLMKGMKAVTESGDSPAKGLLAGKFPVASSLSTVASPWKKFSCFDVYLSCDYIFTTRFKNHLCDRLVTAGIQISPYSLHFVSGGGYLRNSEARASIVVLSENYASSVRCLDELLLILERRAKSNHFVLPVFYDVEASDVRGHQRLFALRWYQTSSTWKGKVDRWKAALTEVANLPGFHVSRYVLSST